MTFKTFVVGCWNERFCWKSVCYNIKEEKVMRKCMCIFV
jgi:hypothetical protein